MKANDWKIKSTGEKIEFDEQNIKGCDWKIKVGEKNQGGLSKNSSSLFFSILLRSLYYLSTNGQ